MLPLLLNNGRLLLNAFSLPFEQWPQDISDYVLTSLLRDPPNTTFEMYTAEKILAGVGEEGDFLNALDVGYLPLANDNGMFYAYQLKTR